jgi:hypothetical protein
MSRIANTPASNPVSVYDGSVCIGHVLHRARVGYEAYDHDDKAIGFYPSQTQAADALRVQP